MDYQLFPLGDHAVVIELGQDINLDIHQKVQQIISYLDDSNFEWMIEYIPAFTTVTIFFDSVKISQLINRRQLPYEYVCEKLEQLLAKLSKGKTVESRIIEVPVCYGGELGPDIETVAELNRLTTDEVIHIHTSSDYVVFMIGFAPGFPYIGGMSESIAAPRRATPRLTIPAGSVGIAGKQTGIYPIETPGGWQLIGRTPLKLFRPYAHPPSLLKPGDTIKFKSISYKEYIEREKEANDHSY